MGYQPIKFYQTGTFTVGNRLLAPEERSVQAGEKRYNSLNSGHRACQGCGEAPALWRHRRGDGASASQLVAPTPPAAWKCSPPLSETSRSPIHSLFGNTAAVATGIAAALKSRADMMFG